MSRTDTIRGTEEVKPVEKILIVEDEEDIRDMLVETLSRLNYETVIAENGQIGLEQFERHSVSLVITDIRMPVMDGVDMLKVIRRQDKKVPIIVITGYPSVRSAVDSLVEGADYYLVKPINLTDLEVKIDKALQKTKMLHSLDVARKATFFLVLTIPLWIGLGILLAKLI